MSVFGDATDPSAANRAEIECRQIAELLADYLDGTLPQRTADLIEWHIDACAPCVAFVNTYRGTIRATRSLSDLEVPAELRNRLLSVLRETKRDASPG